MPRRSTLIVVLTSVFATGAAAGGATSFPRLTWSVDPRVPHALKVFPAPADPAVVFASSAQGLWRTHDDAATWQLIPRTGPDVLGAIAHLAVCPARPERMALASTDKGVFLSEDGGTTWRPAGGVEAGLAGPAVVQVAFPDEDRAWQTLLAGHGDKHPGISRSIDGGRTWRVISPKRHLTHFVSLGTVLSGSSATRDEPDDWAIVFSQSFGENWRPVLRGREGVVGCETATRRKWLGPKNAEFFGWKEDVLWGVRQGRLLLSQDMEEGFHEVGPERGGRWASVFTTPGADPEQQWLWAYDPYRNGLVGANTIAPRGEWQPNNYGLLVTRMIKRGANAAANAQGTTFYACVNHALYVGRHAANEEGPTVRLARAAPATMLFPPAQADKAYEDFQQSLRTRPATDDLLDPPAEPQKERKAPPPRRLDVTVQVTHPRGANAVTTVRVVPDLLGVRPTELHDDGAHGDGKAHDGLWGGALALRGVPQFAGSAKDRRRSLPGIRPIAVEAMDSEGKVASWTMMVGVYYEPAPFMLWDTGWWGARSILCQGQATVDRMPNADGKTRHLRISGREGPWTMCWSDASGTFDITGLKHVAFEFTGSPGAGDVSFGLVDGLDRLGTAVIGPIEPNFPSRFIPLLAGKHLPAMDGKRHTVRIPVSELTRGIRFMRTCVAGFGLRAETGAGRGTYDFGRVWVEN